MGFPATDTITGQVRAMRIVRDGWGIAQVALASGDAVTPVVGTLLGFEVGDTVEAQGTWTTHPQYGRQFKARIIRTLLPSSADGFITWISRRLPGIGRKRATALVEHWGSPERVHEALLAPGAERELAAVPGIGEAAAAKIVAAYREVSGERERMSAFAAYGLTDRQIARVMDAWGEHALERLREDPYELIECVDGFGFKRADAVALAMGTPRAHPSRICAALHHVLGEAETAGHCYVPAGKLVAIAAGLLEVAAADVWPHLRTVTDGRRAVDRSGWVYRSSTDRAEASVASRVVEMLGAP